MKTLKSNHIILAFALLSTFTTFHVAQLSAAPVGTAFTYHGRLIEGANPATGIYDFRFAICDSATNGSTVAGPLTNSAVGVTNGLFMTTLDFGAGVFTGDARWLEIAVRTNGSAGNFTTLSPRQSLTPTPYALYATNAGTACCASNLLGALPGAQLTGTYSNVLTFNNAVNSFSGSGAGLTALNANNLASGTVPDARLSANVSLLGASIESAEITDGTIVPVDLNLTAFNTTFWRTTGNSGTTPGTHFLGTTDNQPLELWVNNQRGLRLEPTTFTDTVNVIGGSARNFVGVGVVGATIGGGGAGFYGGGTYTNRVEANFGTVSGGMQNTIQTDAICATIGGGYTNNIGTNCYESTIGGGSGNNIAANSSLATIAGGLVNDIGTNSYYSAIGGGHNNRIAANSSYATISGGYNNDIGTNSVGSAIGGGYTNNIGTNSYYNAIGGGSYNRIAADSSYATISGGYNNDIGTNSLYSAIGGGGSNSIATRAATIGGGYDNDIGTNSDYSAIGGGYANNIAANSLYATIAGGFYNNIGTNSYSSAIGEGYYNWIAANAPYATIPGGMMAKASGYGQMAYASGGFVSPGDAQSSLFVARRTTSGLVTTELFLDGTSRRMTVPSNTTWTFEILVAARSSVGEVAAYIINGMISRAGDTTYPPVYTVNTL